MPDVERLEAELAVAKLSEKLEAAREAMHKKRGSKPSISRDDPTVVKYNDLSDQVATARVAFREKFPPPKADEGDGQARPATVHGKAGAKNPGSGG